MGDESSRLRVKETEVVGTKYITSKIIKKKVISVLW